MNSRFPAFIIVCVMLCACSIQGGHTQYRVTSIKSGGSLNAASQKTYVAVPHNSSSDAGNQDAVSQTRQALQAALGRNAGEKFYASQPESLPDGLARAKAAACAYLIWTEVLDWHDPPASFQTSSDRGELMLSVYDAHTGVLLLSDNISCNGSATTVNLIGMYSPKDCLKPALDEWVAKKM